MNRSPTAAPTEGLTELIADPAVDADVDATVTPIACIDAQLDWAPPGAVLRWRV